MKKNTNFQKLRPLLRAVEKNKEGKETKDKRLFYRYSNGELATDYKGVSVVEICCREYNDKLRKAYAFVNRAMVKRPLAIIQHNFWVFYPLYKRSRLLNEWCYIHNKKLDEMSKEGNRIALIRTIPTIRQLPNGECEAVNSSDELLVKWCKSYNKKLHDNLKIIEDAKDKSTPYPLYIDEKGMFYPTNKRAKKLKMLCEIENNKSKLNMERG